MIWMYWRGTKTHPRVDLQAKDFTDALSRAKRRGLRIFHLFEDQAHKQMLGTWRQDVLGKWDFISAR
jgi:hypothetical protein